MDQSCVFDINNDESQARRSRTHQSRALSHFRRLDEHIRGVVNEAAAMRSWVNELMSEMHSQLDTTPQNSSASASSDDSSDDAAPNHTAI